MQQSVHCLGSLPVSVHVPASFPDVSAVSPDFRLQDRVTNQTHNEFVLDVDSTIVTISSVPLLSAVPTCNTRCPFDGPYQKETSC